jgi:hypothetical protein
MLFPWLLWATFGCPRPPLLAREDDRIAVGERLAAFRQQTLAPAHVPPPSLSQTSQQVSDGSVQGQARLLRPEEAAWNRWVDGEMRLFNNRAALLFEITLQGPGPLGWDPESARLEINDESTVLLAAGSAEVLLAELLFHAYLEQQWGFDGDLVNRTRAAGAFRMAYAPTLAPDDTLSGVIAFPLLDLPAMPHVVALRLTLTITAEDGVHVLVWVLD